MAGYANNTVNLGSVHDSNAKLRIYFVSNSLRETCKAANKQAMLGIACLQASWLHHSINLHAIVNYRKAVMMVSTL